MPTPKKRKAALGSPPHQPPASSPANRKATLRPPASSPANRKATLRPPASSPANRKATLRPPASSPANRKATLRPPASSPANRKATLRPPASSPANRKATLRPRPVWSDLPPNVLREIYLCSAFEDRISMGKVCKSWRKSYRDPVLWRSRLFEFGGCTAMEKLYYELFAGAKRGCTFTSGHNAKGLADQFSTSLKNLEILFKDMSHGSAKGILRDFLKFYSSLEESRLRSLTLYNLDLRSLNGPMRTRFVNSFMKVTSGQKFLKKLRMDFPNFDLESSLQFLKCVADSCGDTLKTIYLKRRFEKAVPLFYQQQMVTELENHFQKLKGLCRIHVEYSIVSENMIKHWTLGCPKLSFIKFWVNINILPCNVISCNAWQNLANTHPNLLVEIHAQLIESTRQMLPILATAMPVYRLTWKTWDEGTLEIDLKCLLHRVACYHRTIKVLFVEVAGEFPNLDHFSVQKILANCRKLLPFVCSQTKNPIQEASWTLVQK